VVVIEKKDMGGLTGIVKRGGGLYLIAKKKVREEGKVKKGRQLLGKQSGGMPRKGDITSPQEKKW